MDRPEEQQRLDDGSKVDPVTARRNRIMVLALGPAVALSGAAWYWLGVMWPGFSLMAVWYAVWFLWVGDALRD